MKTAILLGALASGSAAIPMMKGDLLCAGLACYPIVAGDWPIGTTSQTITASRQGQWLTRDIAVHQKLANGSFEMRDRFVLDPSTLLPIRMDSQRMLARTDRGWQRVSLRYARDRVHGTKETAAGTVAIDTPLPGPTWDGNQWDGQTVQ